MELGERASRFRFLIGDRAGRVFRLLPVNPGPDISTPGAAVLADLSLSEARGMLVGLTHACMVEAATAGAGRWRMHDLVRRYAWKLSTPTRRPMGVSGPATG